MIHLEINGKYEYEDYFSNPHAERKICVPIPDGRDITGAVNLLIRNVRAINKWTTSLLNMDLSIDGKIRNRRELLEEKVEIRATALRVKMQLRNILPEFHVDRLSVEMRPTKCVHVQQNYRGSELSSLSDFDVLGQLISKLTRKVLHEEGKVDRIRKAYAYFIASACSKTRKPWPEFYATYMQDTTETVLKKLATFVASGK